MDSRYLLFTFLLIIGLSGVSAGQQKFDPSQQKPVIKSVTGNLNWYDLQKQ